MNTTDSKKTGDGVLGCAAIVLLAPAIAFNGFVAMKLWNWHLTTFGLQRVSLSQSVGALAFLALLRMNADTTKRENWGEDALKVALQAVMLAAYSLLVGYIAYRMRGAA